MQKSDLAELILAMVEVWSTPFTQSKSVIVKTIKAVLEHIEGSISSKVGETISDDNSESHLSNTVRHRQRYVDNRVSQTWYQTKHYDRIRQLSGWTKETYDERKLDDELVSDLIRQLVLNSTSSISTTSISTSELLSPCTFSVIKCLELVARSLGWAWTFNSLIVSKLWRLLEPSTPARIMVSVIRLFGVLGKAMIDDPLLPPLSYSSAKQRQQQQQQHQTTMREGVREAISELRKRLGFVISPLHRSKCKLIQP